MSFRHGRLLHGYLGLLLLSGSVLSIHSSEASGNYLSDVSKSVGDPVNGERVYQRCIGCHSLDRNRTGPKHCGLFGRKAGSAQGFEYSRAMSDSDLVWDEHSLDRFLKAPLTALPGTTMGFSGVKQDQDRRDLIVYLKRASNSEECR